MEKSKIKSTLFPFVLLLGNHSSGKSSFVNYLMNRKIQQMGVAPTDDCFTLIAPSDCQEIDRDGNSLIGDPDLGFSDLKSFGPVLVHKTQLKIRVNTAVKNFMIVDSPGMIDSPLVPDHFGSGRHSVMDRGYDFEAVCKWYADRADVILLFFDPDKPGTTGETLSILTNSLSGMDHKLHIILNKADQFRKIHDFARAYGSLCWNLSKVIQRKDMPQIHTMCLPIADLGTPPLSSTTNGLAKSSYGVDIKDGGKGASNGSAAAPGSSAVLSARPSHSPSPSPSPTGSASNGESEFLRQGYADLAESRLEVTREVFNAPKRRVDHEVSRLAEAVHILQMHCKVMQYTVARYRRDVWTCRLTMAACSFAVVGGVVAVGWWLSQTNSSSTDPPHTPLPATTDAATAPSTVSTTNTLMADKSGDKVTTEGDGKFGLFFRKADPPAPPLPAPPTSTPTPSPSPSPSPSTSTSTSTHTSTTNAQTAHSPFAHTLRWLKGVLITTCGGAATVVGLHQHQRTWLERRAAELVSVPCLTEAFYKCHARAMADKDEYARAVWVKVLEKMRISISADLIDLARVPVLSKVDMVAMERIMEEDIANLRRKASPHFPYGVGSSSGSCSGSGSGSSGNSSGSMPGMLRSNSGDSRDGREGREGREGGLPIRTRLSNSDLTNSLLIRHGSNLHTGNSYQQSVITARVGKHANTPSPTPGPTSGPTSGPGSTYAHDGSGPTSTPTSIPTSIPASIPASTPASTPASIPTSTPASASTHVTGSAQGLGSAPAAFGKPDPSTSNHPTHPTHPTHPHVTATTHPPVAINRPLPIQLTVQQQIQVADSTYTADGPRSHQHSYGLTKVHFSASTKDAVTEGDGEDGGNEGEGGGEEGVGEDSNGGAKEGGPLVAAEGGDEGSVEGSGGSDSGTITEEVAV